MWFPKKVRERLWVALVTLGVGIILMICAALGASLMAMAVMWAGLA